VTLGHVMWSASCKTSHVMWNISCNGSANGSIKDDGV
jgi:hypothetical protein